MAAKLLGVEPDGLSSSRMPSQESRPGAMGASDLVIGVARKGNADELKQYGAHLVINDLEELVD